MKTPSFIELRRRSGARDPLQVKQIVTSIQPAQVFDALLTALGIDAALWQMTEYALKHCPNHVLTETEPHA
jgi:hypothetical protein